MKQCYDGKTFVPTDGGITNYDGVEVLTGMYFWRYLFLPTKLNLACIVLDIGANRDGNIPEVKRVSINVVERFWILGVSEGPDGVGSRDLHSEYVMGIITVYKTVELDD
jgi:hypothetical protein